MRIIKLLLVVAMVAVLAVAVALIAVPAESFRPWVERAATAALGRGVTIDGPLRWELWPPLTIEAAGIRVANLPGRSPEAMVAADRLRLRLDAAAYLDGTVRLEQAELDRPRLHLQRYADGIVNWRLGETEADGGQSGGERDDDGGLPQLALGEVQVVQGSFVYVDELAGIRQEASAVDLDLGQEGQALVATGEADYNGHLVRLDARLDDLDAALAGGSTGLRATLTSALATLRASGTFGPGAADGVSVEGRADDLAGLVRWLRLAEGLPAQAPPAAALEAELQATPGRVTVSRLALAAGPWSVDGSLDLQLGERPKIAAALTLGAVDLTPWTLTAADRQEAAPAPAGDAAGWPSAPVPLPLPLPVDLDLSVAFPSLRAGALELGAGSVGLYADSLSARLELPELALYGGQAEGGLAIREFGESPLLDLRVVATQVQAGPLLQALGGFDRVEGTAHLRADLATTGGSVAAWIERLDGAGELLLRDGALLGINLAALLRQVASLGLDSDASQQRRTDFAELGGTFTIADGILTNDDLLLRAPVLRLAGAGKVDLPAQTLDYAVTPRLSPTLEGQDAQREPVIGAGVPLVVSGAWADPRLQLAIGGTLSGDLREPAALAALVGQLGSDPGLLAGLREQFGLAGDNPALDALGAILGGDEGEAGVPAVDQLEDAAEAAKSGLDRLKERLGGGGER